MTNGLIFFITVLISLFFILLMLRFGEQGLAGLIVTNIILVSCFGALLIPLFGLTTNAGNVFYASIFLTAQVMTEHYGRWAAYRSIAAGFGALVLFVLLAQYSVRLVGVPGSDQLASSMQTVFTGVPRIALASMVAYLFSQSLNIWLFDLLRRKTHKRALWFRAIVSSTAGQVVDSVLFFVIAFAYSLSNDRLLEAMTVGFLVKMIVAILGVPILYASTAVFRTSRISQSELRELRGD